MSQVLSPREFLQDLIAFKTISGASNRGMIDYLEKYVKKLGFDTVRIKNPKDPERANLLCFIGPKKAQGLMLSGHTDVVPVLGQNWDSDPFVLHERENKLFGRGSTDMKGFIAALCHALSKINYAKLIRPLSLLFTYDEEIGCKGSAHCAPLLKNTLPAMPEAAIIGEPTDFAILRMHSGHTTLKILAKGKGAHSSDPALGISAIKAMHQVLSGLFSLEQKLKSEISLAEFFLRPYVTLNVGTINGGSAVNIIPDETVISVGLRPLPNIPVGDLISRINLITQAASKESGAHILLSEEDHAPAMITRANSKLEQVILPHAKASTQVAAAFATDAGNLNQEGIECLIFGPGSINIAHQTNEFINKDDLNFASEKISQIVEKYLT